MNALTTYPEIRISSLTQLQWAVETAEQAYRAISAKVEECWKLFDEAIDSNESYEDRNLLAETAEAAEKIKHDLYTDWQEAQAVLLSMWN